MYKKALSNLNHALAALDESSDRQMTLSEAQDYLNLHQSLRRVIKKAEQLDA